MSVLISYLKFNIKIIYLSFRVHTLLNEVSLYIKYINVYLYTYIII